MAFINRGKNDPLCTLNVLPKMENRFGSAPFAADVILRVRDEHASMRRVIAKLVPEKPAEQLSMADVDLALSRLDELETKAGSNQQS